MALRNVKDHMKFKLLAIVFAFAFAVSALGGTRSYWDTLSQAEKADYATAAREHCMASKLLGDDPLLKTADSFGGQCSCPNQGKLCSVDNDNCAADPIGTTCQIWQTCFCKLDTIYAYPDWSFWGHCALSNKNNGSLTPHRSRVLASIPDGK